jgi:formate/nitrite transporter FocA (FNT family)
LLRLSFVATRLREYLGVYILASMSNIFLAASQYLAVSAAVASYVPVDPGTSALITTYGRSPGIFLALLLNSLVFQGFLLALVLTLALPAIASWRWAYALLALVISGFVGYWLGAKFLVVLEWISTLQNNGVDSSNPYSGLFWFGLAASICYILMIILLRKSYGKLAETEFRRMDL